MSYQVLARKWRPKNFKEMVGQRHVLKALINALDSDRLHHAYLFTGTRGVGKTTIARILAKCLNCETGVTSEPCGICGSCVEIAEGRFVDLIEVDAASRTKVEDTRELLDNVQYAPTRGRFKVYLIDEVHMLSGHSFNALLKTLEEPPSHVKFLFATTDPQKLPVTILSRCLQFNLKRMTVDMISGHLSSILSQESISNEASSLRLIARAADGSMRDALSLLDQAISFGGGELKEPEVREMLGTISHEPLLMLLKAVAAGDGQRILDDIEKMASVTPDFDAATDALITLLHKMAVLQVVPEAEEDDVAIKALADQFSREDVQLYYQIALHGRRDLPLSPDRRNGFEMIFLRLLTFRPLANIAPSAVAQNKKKTLTTETTPLSQAVMGSLPKKESVKESIEDAPPWDTYEPVVKEQESLSQQVAAVFPTQEKVISQSLSIDHEVAVAALENSSTLPLSSAELPVKADVSIENKLESEWHEIVPRLNITGCAAELVKHCVLSSIENDQINITLDKSGEALISKATESQVESALSEFYGRVIKLEIKTLFLNNETPAQRNERLDKERLTVAEDMIKNDSFVLELQERFAATLVPQSVIVK